MVNLKGTHTNLWWKELYNDDIYVDIHTNILAHTQAHTHMKTRSYYHIRGLSELNLSPAVKEAHDPQAMNESTYPAWN